MSEAISVLAQGDPTVELNAGGVVVMTLSVLLVMGLLIFCLSKILREPHPETHHHAPLDIDTKSRD
jgi:hypothetical protein